jgi:hypothetical protein
MSIWGAAAVVYRRVLDVGLIFMSVWIGDIWENTMD